jgi:hypothetical protein
MMRRTVYTLCAIAGCFSLPALTTAQGVEYLGVKKKADGTIDQAQVATMKTKFQNAGKQPNILFIMGDDIGMWNIGAYHRGMMAGRTPNIDKLAREGAIFTDYYAEASCTAGRANFITGELPIRTGLTTVGQAGATIGLPAEAPTIATVLKEVGYATGQFGKNHLGDRNEFLPTVHGFDEFFGDLYHLDAMEDPFHPNYPQDLKDKVGPRRDLARHRVDSGGRPDRRFQIRLHRTTRRLVRTEGQNGLAGDLQPASRPVREDEHWGFAVRRQLVDL